jgi:hypothetical protein
MSERTWRDNPPIKTFLITPNVRGTNVGELRDLTSGQLVREPEEIHQHRQPRHYGRYTSKEDCNGHT